MSVTVKRVVSVTVKRALLAGGDEQPATRQRADCSCRSRDPVLCSSIKPPAQRGISDEAPAPGRLQYMTPLMLCFRLLSSKAAADRGWSGGGESGGENALWSREGAGTTDEASVGLAH